MARASKKTPGPPKPPKKPSRLPWWAYLGIGLATSLFIFLVSNMTPYVSEWFEEDSSYYDNSWGALKQMGINPSAPTLIMFWDKACDECKESMRAVNNSHRSLRVYGIHVDKGDVSELEIRQAWIEHGPKHAILIMDKSQMLKSSFGVKSTPYATLILPKQKKMYSYLGNLKDGRSKMIELIQSEL